MPLRDALRARFPLLRALPPTVRIAVGGAVRDLLLGRDPKDVDVECDDPLAAARSLGRKVIQLGRDGDDLVVWRVVDGDHIYDFAPVAPLGRRDLTINAIAVDLQSGELRDPFGGARDLEAGVVRMIDPKNFDDDPLRLLRAARFSVTLGFRIDDGTLEAVRARAATITTVAAERIEVELAAIFSAGKFRRALEMLHASRLDVPLFGRELDAAQFHADDVSLAAAYALLGHDTTGPIAREIADLRRLIDRHHRIALYDAGERVASQLPALLRALGRDDRLDLPDFSIRALLTGDEIVTRAGVEPGPKLGAIKRALLEAQIRGEVRTRQEAEAFVTASA